ncbi:MAG: glycoside hydrolase family 2 TIM barrel-domain containing protein [Candidatus Hadarchaeales archaeon]
MRKKIIRTLRLGTISGVFLFVAFTIFFVRVPLGSCQSPPKATLSPSLELRSVDGVDVPFQNGVPFPSFERQPTRLNRDLSGLWKFKSIPSTSLEIEKSLRERSSVLSLLEEDGYHRENFDDSSWNTRSLPFSENPLDIPVDENVYWYRRTISGISEMMGKYVKLVFLGANYVTDVWINGAYVGWHEGGYTSFVFDVSDYLKYDGSDLIAIRVHNVPWDSRSEQKDIMPYQTCDFRNHGGIYRDIYLEASDTLSIARVDIKPSLVFIDNKVSTDTGLINVNVIVYNRSQDQKSATVELAVYGTRIDNTNILDPSPEAIIDRGVRIHTSGTALKSVDVPGMSVSVISYSLELSGIELWTPETPVLYILETKLNGNLDIFCTQFGVREIKVDGNYPRIMLNRVPTFLAGVARHEAMPDVFNRFTVEQMENLMRDFNFAKEANVNFIRTAHYPNHPYLYILADRMGFMIWEEMSATWFVDEGFGVILERGIAEQMWLEMIYRDYNRPSIIIWSTNNEADIHQPEPAAGMSNRYRFNERMKELAYRVDGTRLVAQATFWNIDPTWPVDDILGINEYQGVFYYSWAPVSGEYYTQTRSALKNSHDYQPDKPIVASEMGTWSCEDMSRTSEQLRCFVDTFKALDERPYVSGTVWWCLFDWWQARGSAQTMGAITWDRDYIKPVYYAIKNTYENTWTRPWVKILTPLDGSILKESVDLEVLAEDYRGDRVGIEMVEYSLDGGGYVRLSRKEGDIWVTSIDTGTLSDGEHVLVVRATDIDGQSRTHSITLRCMNLFRWVQSDWSGSCIPEKFVSDEDTIAYWDFERMTRGIIDDVSGNRNSGVITGLTLVEGKHGYGIKFENSEIDTNAAPSVKIKYNERLNFVSGDFSVQFWVRADLDYPAKDKPASDKGWRIFIRQDNKLNGDWWDGCWWVGYDEWWNELAFVVRNEAGNEKKVAYRFSFDAGRWYNVAAVKDSSTLKLYIDGVLRAFGDAPEDYQPCGDIYIGYHRTNPSDPIFLTFNGVIDEMRILRRALSDEEVKRWGAWAEVGSWSENYNNHSDAENVNTEIPGSITLSLIGNKKPTADFSFSPFLPTLANGNNEVQFTDLSTDPDGTIVRWYWDFGDGTTSNERNPLHLYEKDGIYDVTLTVTDDEGENDVMADVLVVYWDIVMFQDFEPGNGTPSQYYYDSWSSRPTFDANAVFGGTRSLRMNAIGSGGDPSFHGGGTVGINVASPEGKINMQNAHSIFMWVLDTQGNNTLELRLRDNTGSLGPAWWSNDHPALNLTGIAVKDNWTKFAWDLESYYGVDKSRIIGIELYEWWDGYYYFDNICFGMMSGFTITSDQTIGKLSGSGQVNLSLSIKKVGPYDKEIELTYQGAPEDVTVNISKTKGIPDFDSTMNIRVGPRTPPGIYEIRIFGIGADGKVRSCVYTLVVGEKSFQDFEPSNGTLDNYTYEVYYTDRFLSYGIVHGGLQSICVHARASQGAMPLEFHGGAFGVNAASTKGYIDLYNAAWISLWIYDNVGNNTVELTVVDVLGRKKTIGYSQKKSIKNSWTMLVWDISGKNEDPEMSQQYVDMSLVKALQFYVWWDGYYYFDDISYFEGEVSRNHSIENSSSGPVILAAVKAELSESKSLLFSRAPQIDYGCAEPGRILVGDAAAGKGDYSPRGYLKSSIYDAGIPVYWGNISWSAEVPPLTSVKVYVRAGNFMNPEDGGWSDWSETGNGWDLPFCSRYIQYMIVLETQDGKVTPRFKDITITYSLQEEFSPLLLLLAIILLSVTAVSVILYLKRKKRLSGEFGDFVEPAWK